MGEDGLQLAWVHGEAGFIEQRDGLEAGGGCDEVFGSGEGIVAVLVFCHLNG